MHRILFALVALFMGLVTQVAPAQARLSAASETEIGAALSVGVVLLRTVPASKVSSADNGPDPRALRRDYLVLPRPSAAVPTVLVGIDRARE